MTRRLKVNSKLCTLCGLCTLVCAERQTGTSNLNLGAIRVLSHLPVAYKTNINYCLQCNQAYCIDACPRNALYRDSKDVVHLNKETCDRCNNQFLCVKACKHNGIFTMEGLSYPLKCDVCNNEMPRCVAICPVKSITLVE